MARDIIDFPASLTRWRKFVLTPDPQTRTGSAATDGNAQISFGNQPRWRLDATLLLQSRRDVMAWRGVRSLLKGRLNILRIPINDPMRPSLSEIGLLADDIAAIEGTGIPYSDDASFSDGAGFGYSPSTIVIADCAAGAVSVTVDARALGDTLAVGNYFSIDDWLYQITGISGTSAARTYSFQFPLRRACPAGSVLEAHPSGLFVFQEDLAGAASLSYDTAELSEVPLQLVEWVARP